MQHLVSLISNDCIPQLHELNLREVGFIGKFGLKDSTERLAKL